MNPNDLMSQLHDIQLAEPIGWWPPAMGWWFVLVLLVSLIVLVIWWWRKPTVISLKKQIDSEFARIRKEHLTINDTLITIKDLSQLLRRISMSVRERKRVAGLSGYSWQLELDELSGSEFFTRKAGKIFSDAPYMSKPQLDNLLEENNTSIDELLDSTHQAVTHILNNKRGKR